jgi:lipase chaperone LimK
MEPLEQLLEKLPFSVRIYNCFYNQTKENPDRPLRTIRDLTSWSPYDLLKLQHFGRRSLLEVEAILDSQGFFLNDTGEAPSSLREKLEADLINLEAQKSYLEKRIAQFQQKIDQYRAALSGITEKEV